jgi:hypothetical protein
MPAQVRLRVRRLSDDGPFADATLILGFQAAADQIHQRIVGNRLVLDVFESRPPASSAGCATQKVDFNNAT